MLTIQCRLCSSPCGLISLFSGKSRKNRDYLRKLVEITIGLKIEKDDLLKHICYTCIIQVYNFYIFRVRCVENEQSLEDFRTKDENTKSKKYEISNLASITLPDTAELQSSLSPWLISKSKYCDTAGSECEGILEHHDLNRCKDEHSTVENSTQYDMEQNCDVSTQCHIPKDTSHKGCQTSLCALEVYTQTSCVSTKSTKVQCCLPKETFEDVKKSFVDSFVQTSLKHVSRKSYRDSSTQTSSKKFDKDERNEKQQKTDYKCTFSNLVRVKEEKPLENSVNSSNHFSVSVNPSDSNPPSASSPISDNSPVQRWKYCRSCNQSFESDISYTSHMKAHKVCDFCGKKLRSAKRTRWHVENECTVKRMVKLQPGIHLARLEKLKEVHERYPDCLQQLKAVGVKRGGLYDNVHTSLVNGDSNLKSKVEIDDSVRLPAKKIKLSRTFGGKRVSSS